MEQEKNYHIFYDMLAGAPPDMRQALGLDTRQSFLVSKRHILGLQEHNKVSYNNSCIYLSYIAIGYLISIVFLCFL